MNNDIILAIVEGEVFEKSVLNSLEKHFFNSLYKKIIILPYKTEIYTLYRKLKDDDFETDIVELLIETNTERRDEINKNKALHIANLPFF